MMTNEDLARLFMENGALLDGHFELRSGLHSPKYCQCALLQQKPRLLETLVAELIERMRAELGDAMEVDTVIAPAMGGITIGHEMGRQLDKRFIFAEKEEGKLVLRRGQTITPGETFLIGEDVITRGGRIQESYDIVTAAGGIVNGIGVLFNRSGGTASFAAPLVSLVTMTPVVYNPGECPLCRDGIPLDHPGSK